MDERLEALQELYDALPTIACKGLCANSCGPIEMSEAEHTRIIELGILIPHFTREASQRWANQEPLHCPALNRTTLRCDVYEARPMICRLWGMTESMPCPHGCEPTQVMTDRESYQALFKSFLAGGHPLYRDPAEMESFLELLDDGEIGPLIARFIRGDRSVEPQIVALMEKRKAATECKTDPSASSAPTKSTTTPSTKPSVGTTDVPARSGTPSA